MPAGDIFELSVDQVYGGQEISNVHHYVQVGADGAGDARTALANVWTVFYELAYLNSIVAGILLLQTRVRRLFPTQTQQFFTGVSLNGSILQVGLPTNQCAILREYATLSGRKGVGHVKMPGVGIDFVNEGRIDSSYRGIAEIFGDVFEADRTDGVSGFSFRSVVLGTDDVARQIQLTRMTSRIKQVRSRTVGVGD